MNESLPPGWKVKSLGDLFDKHALVRLKEILQKRDLEGLDVFLQEHRDELMAKGVLPKYLFYYLSYAFKLEEQ